MTLKSKERIMRLYRKQLGQKDGQKRSSNPLKLLIQKILRAFISRTK